MDYAALQAEAIEALLDVGFTITLVNASTGATVGTKTGVFVKSKTAPIESSSLPGVSMTPNTAKTLLLSPTGAVPAVGQKVTCSQGTFFIRTVEVICPTTVVLLYRVEVD